MSFLSYQEYVEFVLLLKITRITLQHCTLNGTAKNYSCTLVLSNIQRNDHLFVSSSFLVSNAIPLLSFLFVQTMCYHIFKKNKGLYDPTIFGCYHA